MEVSKEQTEQFIEAVENNTLAEFFNVTSKGLDQLEKLAAGFALVGNYHHARILAEGIMTLDPNRDKMQELHKRIEKFTAYIAEVQEQLPVAAN